MDTEALMRLWKSPAVIETVKTIVYALLIVSVILTFIFRPYVIPSSSMKDTLLVGDYVFVTKFSYGYSKYSFFFSPNIFSGRIWGADPERGDVVVFRKPSQPDVDYIKRVVGLPGDRVQMIGGKLYINGEMAKQEPAGYFDEEESDCPAQQPVPRFHETLPGGVVHDVLDCRRSELDETQEFVVPAGHYFMMGDNRDNSADSRDLNGGVGFVPAENLIGKAQFIIISAVCYDEGRCKAHIWEFWKWPWAIRYDRFFKPVD
jgi:signal peptidase I